MKIVIYALQQNSEDEICLQEAKKTNFEIMMVAFFQIRQLGDTKIKIRTHNTNSSVVNSGEVFNMC